MRGAQNGSRHRDARYRDPRPRRCDRPPFGRSVMETRTPSGEPVRLTTRIEYANLVRAARLDISARYARPDFVSRDVATRLNVSDSTLQRAFRYRGTTFKRLLTEARMMRAADLLARQSSCAEVAARVGYRSSSRLSEAFLRYYGVPPTTLRSLYRAASRQAWRHRHRVRPDSWLHRRMLKAGRRDARRIRVLLADLRVDLLSPALHHRLTIGAAWPDAWEQDDWDKSNDPIPLPIRRGRSGTRTPSLKRRGRRWPTSAARRANSADASSDAA
jgi:AraC-like DNA-binding protein